MDMTHFSKLIIESHAFADEFKNLTYEDLAQKYTIIENNNGYITLYVGDKFDILHTLVIIQGQDGRLHLDRHCSTIRDNDGREINFKIEAALDCYVRKTHD